MRVTTANVGTVVPNAISGGIGRCQRMRFEYAIRTPVKGRGPSQLSHAHLVPIWWSHGISPFRPRISTFSMTIVVGHYEE